MRCFFDAQHSETRMMKKKKIDKDHERLFGLIHTIERKKKRSNNNNKIEKPIV